MKNPLFILCFLCFVPMVALAQLKTIALQTEGIPLTQNKTEIPESLNKFFALPPMFSFNLINSKTVADKNGEQHFTYQQFYKNYPIANTVIKMHYRNDKLYYINGEYLSSVPNDLVIDALPKIDEKDALSIAAPRASELIKYIWDDLNEMKLLLDMKDTALIYPAPHAELVIFIDNSKEPHSVHLAYKFDIFSIQPLSRHYVYIDAKTGKVIAKHSRIHHLNGTADTRYSGQRTIGTDYNNSTYRLRDYGSNRGNGIETFNMNHGTSYSTATDFTDANNNWTASEYHNSAKDDGALDAHWGAMMTYDYFLNVHGRDSYDENGSVIRSYIHYDNNYENAYWNGSVMTYGDGDHDFDILTSIDVVGHEIGHAVCQYSANLVYSKESGAINEGLSDIWGACIENFATTGKQTWLLGEDIDLRSGHNGLRSMSNPNIEGQPDTYGGTNWFSVVSCTPTVYNDYCGVHTNSGIMNYWFYLLCAGGTGTNDPPLNNAFNVTAIGMTDAASIVYRAETVYMTANTTYANARTFTIQAAQDIFGNCSQQVKSTINAWYAVGVGKSYSQIETLVITDPISANINKEEYATGTITASNVISGTNTNVNYLASESVKLVDGFTASSGTNFVARIVSCRDISSSKYGSNPGISQSEYIPEWKDLVKIYPNPTHESFSLKFLNNNYQNSQVKIYDIYGKPVIDIFPEANIIQVNMTDLATGVYLCNVSVGGATFSTKILKY